MFKAKFRFWMSMNLVGTFQEEIVELEFPDDISESEFDFDVNDAYQEWVWEKLYDHGFEEIKEGE